LAISSPLIERPPADRLMICSLIRETRSSTSDRRQFMNAHLAFFLAASVLVAADTPSKTTRDDRDRFQGTWRVVTLVDNGKQAPREAIQDARLIFEGNHFSLQGARQDYRGTFKLDQDQDPKSLDCTYHEVGGSDNGRAFGIYELDGNRLKLCWRHGGKERPHAFTSTEGSGTRLLIAERE